MDAVKRRPPHDPWAAIAQEFIARAPKRARRKDGTLRSDVKATLMRLCAERGDAAVGVEIARVYTNLEGWLPMSAEDWKHRRNVRAKLHAAVEAALAALKDPILDEAIQRWLEAGRVMIEASIANDKGRGAPQRGKFRQHVGLDGRTLRAGFRSLGASKHESEDIVAAITLPADGVVSRVVTIARRR